MEEGENWEEAQQPPQKKRTINRLKVDETLLLNETKGLRKLYEECLSFRPTGNEVEDLRRLFLLYSEWHFCLAPHFSFDYVLQKLQKLGSKPALRSFMSRLRKIHKGLLSWDELVYRPEPMGVDVEDFIDLKRNRDDPDLQTEEKRAKLDDESF